MYSLKNNNIIVYKNNHMNIKKYLLKQKLLMYNNTPNIIIDKIKIYIIILF